MLLCMALGCLDSIDVRLDEGLQEGLVIDSKLVAGEPSVFTLQTSKIFNYELESGRLVTMKRVILQNDLGESLEVPTRRTGVYRLEIGAEDAFTIEDGVSFRVLIEQVDGSSLQSEFDPLWTITRPSMASKKLVESIRLDADGREVVTPVYEISTTLTNQSSEPNASARLKWDFVETFRIIDDEDKICYLSNNRDVLNVKVFDTNFLTEEGWVPLFDRFIDPFMARGYYIQAIRESLSEPAFAYWKNVETVVERDGGQFEPPAGRLQGNFSYSSELQPADLFGFFYATRTDTSRIYISPEDAFFPTPFCEIPVPRPPQFPCGDCLEHPRATLVKPAWWTEE
ncbi:MAG: DUF4249 domain-containing protein [Saprospiraceae bacterium]|nr:DUF4249 domain-containing protein [Saprospiraceae bacterium]